MRTALVAIPLVGISLASAAVTVAAHEGDPAFVYEQQHPGAFGPRQLEALLVHTREPVARGTGSAARSARCRPGRSGPKRNPWVCVIRYRAGDHVRYRITVAPDGGFSGADATGRRTVRGCCLSGPAVVTATVPERQRRVRRPLANVLA